MKSKNKSTMTKLINRIILVIFCAIISTTTIAQTTFTESAALPAYNLDVSGNKDGGHAWADYDLDVFIDNHTFGIDIPQNDSTGFFTHVTKKSNDLDVFNILETIILRKNLSVS